MDFELGARRLVALMPKGAKIIHVGMQSHILCLWAVVVNPDEPKEERHFWIVGTEHPLPPSFTGENHVGSIQDGNYVWHIFE